MTDKTEKTTDYRKKFSDALKVCLAESGIATAANLHKETDARGYPVNDSTVRRYVSGNVLPPEPAFGIIQSILEPNITKESMGRLERTYLAAADERGYAVEKDATEQDAETNPNEGMENPWRVAPKTREGYNEPWFDRTTLYEELERIPRALFGYREKLQMFPKPEYLDYLQAKTLYGEREALDYVPYVQNESAGNKLAFLQAYKHFMKEQEPYGMGEDYWLNALSTWFYDSQVEPDRSWHIYCVKRIVNRAIARLWNQEDLEHAGDYVTELYKLFKEHEKEHYENVLVEYYRYNSNKLQTGGGHPLLGSLELGNAIVYFKKNQIASPYFIRLPMFDVDPVETGLDSGMLMCRLVANDFPSMPECSIRAFMTWVESLSKKYGDTAMAQTNDTKQEGRGESTLLWVPQKDTIMQKNIPLNHVETQTYPIGEADKDEQKNIILSQHNCVGFGQMGNNNVLVIGGIGKSREIIQPNLLQAFGSYVILDRGGEYFNRNASFFRKKGYQVRVLNLSDAGHSDQYNPLHYVRDEEDASLLVQCIFNCTSANRDQTADSFWEKTKRAILEALILYMVQCCPKEERNFAAVLKLLNDAKTGEQGLDALDKLFGEAKNTAKEDSFTVRYHVFKQAGKKTAMSILTAAAVRLAVFARKDIQTLTKDDQMEIEMMSEEDTVTFLIPSANDDDAMLINMIYTQMMDRLYKYAAETNCFPLPRQVRFVMDDFASFGALPRFQIKLATMRKYGLSGMLCVHSLAQIKTLYPEDWETIMRSCMAFVYLGADEAEVHQEVVRMVGKMTIASKNIIQSIADDIAGSNPCPLKNANRNFLSVDEVRRMEPGKAVCMVMGHQPLYDDCYDISTHPNYAFLESTENPAKP